MKESFYFRTIQPIFDPENDLKYHNFIVFGGPFDTFGKSNEKIMSVPFFIFSQIFLFV